MEAETIFLLLASFKYLALFVLVILEGFFVTVAGGVLAGQGELNLYAVMVAVTLGDIASDFFYYSFGKKISKTRFAKFLGLSPTQIHRVEKLFTKHGAAKTIVLAKVSSYLAVPVIVAAGAMHMPKKQFYTYCSLTAAGQGIVFVLMGYYFGKQIDGIVGATVGISIAVSVALSAYWVGSHILETSRAKKSIKN